MKIGVMGGTFNPIHLAHLISAEQIRQGLALDQVLFVPSARPPHKSPDGPGVGESQTSLCSTPSQIGTR